MAERTAGMEYLCRLLRAARSPLCPVNGVLVALDFETIRADGPEAAALERAVRGDLRTMHEALRLCAPVTMLVVGLDEERGFRELVRRVGRERAAVQRFGRRFDIRCTADEDELAAFCVHVCGAFEDWIYQLFNAPGALARPGNVELYGLLCKVRTQLQRPLGHILVHGFGPGGRSDAQSDPGGRPVLLSGCYFAATGPTEDRRAFVRGVFDKLDAEQEDVEWTPAALAEDRRYFRLFLAGMLTSAALAAALITLIALAILG
jgi:type VI protein secretion system component VasK